MTAFNPLDLVAAAGIGDDQTADKSSGGFERELPRAGTALLRLQSYLELGVFADAKNPTWKPGRKVRLRFELLHPDHVVSGEKADGSKYSFPDTITVNTKISGPTGSFGKLFAKMNYDGDATHMSQLLGKAFLGTITHKKSADGTKTYPNLDDATREWQIGAPVIAKLDALGVPTAEMTAVPVPELQSAPQLFLWENSGIDDAGIQAMWDSVYIDGEHNGKSKNWIQDLIRSNDDFVGSRTAGVVDSGAATIDTSIADAPTAEVIDLPVADPVPAKGDAPATDADPLAALGL